MPKPHLQVLADVQHARQVAVVLRVVLHQRLQQQALGVREQRQGLIVPDGPTSRI